MGRLDESFMRVGQPAWAALTGPANVPGVYDPTAPLPPRRRTGRTIAIVLGVALAACCAASLTSVLVRGALQQQATNTASNGTGVAGVAAPGQDAPAAPPAQPGLNTPVRDGRFEFVVTGVTCGQTEIVNGWLRAQAQGQFCVAELTVANIGQDARHFADGSQKAYGPQGHQYAADTGAGVVANGNGNAVWNVVNPGNSIAAKVVFDLPPGATITTLELHDSALSGGVKVTLPAT